MERSQITGRHWISFGVWGQEQSIELRDGAQPVPSWDPWDHEAQFSMFDKGVFRVVMVCCGPAAPLPEPPFFSQVRQVEGLLKRANAVTDIEWCDAPHPNNPGVHCELNPRHALAGVPHVHTMTAGVEVKW